MLTEKESKFLEHWDQVKDVESTFQSKLIRGLPMAGLFALPIILSIVLVSLFSPEWFTKISQRAANSSFTILIAIFIIILFFSYFRMHFKWEMNDQLYHELKHKQKKADAAKE